MALGWSEIRSRATTFAFEWKNQGYEKGQSQTFWIEFFEVFGISQKRVAVFEKKVKKIDGKDGYIDLLWKGVLLIEQKSRGKNLERAYRQAAEYFPGLADDELPGHILVSDFERFKLYDLLDNTEIDFALVDLPSKVELFGFMIGFAFRVPGESEKVSVAAAERMAKLHDLLKGIGYSGRELEQYLARLLFCLFADDTGIFEKKSFHDFIAATKQDGSDLAPSLDDLFYRLNVPEEKRLKIGDRQSGFPYVNGGLFAGRLPPAAFDAGMRKILLNCCAFDWGHISPSIFGSMFQAAMSGEKRHELGAHYTEESNIQKIVGPLFMDGLNAEFEAVKTNKNRLQIFHDKISGLKFMDPACGTGNFLIVAYRELRRLETKVLEALYAIESSGGSTIQMVLDAKERAKVNVDQFYGIEIDELACEIARLGMWLMDHQCNLELSNALGMYYVRLPLAHSATIVCGNALRMDWEGIVPKRKLGYILGNPPFVGARNMTTEQKDDISGVFGGSFKGVGNLDYVTAWYKKAAGYIQGEPIKCAFVSTNSITQGEQVALLWKPLFEAHGIKIDFAYRTFQWTSAARGKAAVHCVIVGFSHGSAKTKKTIFDGEVETEAANINPYLFDAPNVFIESRSRPICDVPEIGIGNKPIDGGNYLFTEEEKNEFVKKEPQAEKWFRKWIGSDEFINRYFRYCLWLGDCPPDELRKMPESMKRIEAVRQFRLNSTSEGTRKLAESPRRFHVENMPKSNYIVIPKVSSEKRKYVPIGFLTPETLASDLVFLIPNATLYHFGILTSNVHMAWVRAVCGRLKSDYRYSKDIVYNNFVWPETTEAQKTAIEKLAQGVLEARALFPGSSLADLYDPLAMPPELLKAHRALDRAVMQAYGFSVRDMTEQSCVAELMKRYVGIVGGKNRCVSKPSL